MPPDSRRARTRRAKLKPRFFSAPVILVEPAGEDRRLYGLIS